MSEKKPVPQPLAPENGSTVKAGEDVILAWEAVEGADVYQVQVSTDPSFRTPSPEELIEPGEDMELHEKILDMTVKGATALDVTGALPAGGVTYYWRVRARLADGSWTDWSETWSFFLEEEAVPESLPGEEEAFGPAAELVKTAAHEVEAELTGHHEEVEAVEPDHLPAAQILSIVAVTVVVLILLFYALYQITLVENKATYIALTEQVEYPIREKREREAMEKLTKYAIVDAEKGVYRIPIDRAMELVAQEYWTSEQSRGNR